MKIMIVDDHPEMRRLLIQTLGRLASEVIECSNGAEAVTQSGRHRPDWIIMDLMMEPVGGLEATTRIKAGASSPKIVVFTQFNSPQLRAAAMEARADAFVTKDNLAELVSIIESSRQGDSPTDLRTTT